jgi:hypothetical protein
MEGIVEGRKLSNNNEATPWERRRKRFWVAPEIVRKEACKLAIQHQYFSPEWFAEFKDCLHCESPPYNGYLLKELCSLLLGTEACKYCVRKYTEHCILDSGERD